MTPDPLVLQLCGLGVWTPGFADAAAWARGEVGRSDEPASQTPRAELLPPMLRRRTSLLTRMAAEVAAQAIASGGLDPAIVTVIYGSVYGEIRTTLDLLGALLTTDALSPTKFHNSVHNTAGGYVSIAARNHGGNAALTAGRSTLAMGLLECAGLLGAGDDPAVLVIAEESLPEPLAAGRVYGPLAAAFALRRPGVAGPVVPSVQPVPSIQSIQAVPWNMSGRTCRLRQGSRDEATAAHRLPASLVDNPCAQALVLVDAVLRAEASVVALEPQLPADARGWLLELDARPEVST